MAITSQSMLSDSTNVTPSLNMEKPTFPYSEEQLREAGLWGDDVSESAAGAIQLMRDHPELLKLSLFALQCMNRGGSRSSAISPASSGSPLFSDVLSTLNVARDPAIAPYIPDEYERIAYYNGIAGNGDHPVLVYRSNYSTIFPKPESGSSYIPVKEARGAFGSPLNEVWDTVGPEVKEVIKAWGVKWSSIDLVRFFTYPPPGELDKKGTLGPVVLWIGVIPDSTSADTAHEVSQEILALLLKNGINDTVLEWREAVPQGLLNKLSE